MRIICLLLFFSPASSFAAMSQNIMVTCGAAVEALYSSSDYFELETKCLQGGGHAVISSNQMRIACTAYTEMNAKMTTMFDQCAAYVEAEQNCRGNWVQSGRGSRWAGVCQTCDSELTEYQEDENSMIQCQCPNGYENSIVGIGDTIGACGVRTVIDCSTESGTVTGGEALGGGTVVVDDGCSEEERQLEINIDAVAAEKQALEDSTLPGRVSVLEAEAQNEAIQACTPSYNSFMSECQSVINAEIPSAPEEIKGNSEAQCKHLQSSAEASITKTSGQVSSCAQISQQVLASCRTSISSQSATQNISIGSGNTLAEATASAQSDPSNLSVGDNVNMRNEVSTLASDLQDKVIDVNQQFAEVRRSSEKCIAAFDQGEDGGNQGFGVNPGSFGGNYGDSGGGSSGSSGISELGSALGAAAKAGSLLKNAFSSNGGSSLDLSTNGLGSATAGMDDEAVFPGSNRGTYNKGTSGSTGGGSAGGAKTTSAKALSSGASKVAAQAKKRRSQSAKARNLINGYKNVRASDGGGSLSIKPADFKKHGSKALKAKLAEARKKHGKGLPLIFKNGKFVLDFLAMKDSKRFKARNAAMSDRLKGTSRKTASVADLHVHQNPRLNIFKIMNFRYQRQKFTQEL